MSLPVIDRTIISSGAAIAIYNGKYFWTRDPIELPLALDPFAINADALGIIDLRADDKPPKLPLKLVGAWENLSTLNPFLSAVPGAVVFGADIPLDILRLTDDVMTRFWSAMVTKPPDLTFAAKEILLDTTEFTLMRKNNTAKTAANSFYQTFNLRDSANVYYTLTYGANTTGHLAFNSTAAQIATALNLLASITADGGVTVTGTYKAGFTVTWVTNGDRAGAITATFTGFPSGAALAEVTTQNGSGGLPEIRTHKITPLTQAYGSLDRTTIITQPYEVQWGLTPFDSFSTEAGSKVTWTVGLTEIPHDTETVVNYLFDSLDAQLELVPYGPTADQLIAKLNLQDAGATRGRSLFTQGADLNLVNTGVYFRMYSAVFVGFSERWGRNVRSVGSARFRPTRSLVGGVLSDIAFLGTAAP